MLGMTYQERDNGDKSFGHSHVSMEAKDVSFDPDDWEIVDDDGFIYKRRKVQAPVPIPAVASREGPPVPAKVNIRSSEPDIPRKEMRNLLAQKERYIAEIGSWESLLKQMQDLADGPIPAVSPNDGEDDKLSKIGTSSVLDDIQALELQVTAHEELIRRLGELPKLGERVAQQLEASLLEDKRKFKDKLLQDVPTTTPRTAIQNLT